jgi:DNA-binding XRE family transcriptional regulator
MDRRAAVLLLTESPDFESTWTAACRDLNLETARAGFADLAGEPPVAVVIDGATAVQPRGLLLSCLARARASGAVTALALSGYESDQKLDDLYVELCNGLIARSDDDVTRVVTALRRRSAPERESRFEHLCTAPGSQELLAVLGDGTVVSVDRPVSSDDSGALTVEAIRMHDDRARATVQLKDGSEIELKAVELAQSRAGSSPSSPPAALGDVDGVRLGQRLRALRLAAGLTQAELARRTGIHRPNIARVEAGRHTPSLETLARLAAAIGVSTTRVLAD